MKYLGTNNTENQHFLYALVMGFMYIMREVGLAAVMTQKVINTTFKLFTRRYVGSREHWFKYYFFYSYQYSVTSSLKISSFPSTQSNFIIFLHRCFVHEVQYFRFILLLPFIQDFLLSGIENSETLNSSYFSKNPCSFFFFFK